MKKRDYPIGSISSGTMRHEDLIPDFTWELKRLAKEWKRKDHLNLVKEIEKRMETEGYFESEDADYDLNEDLFNALNEYAAPYFYFGSHPGDGADYGFWFDSDSIDFSFDGLKVDGLSEVPKDYSGEIFVINDHGNTSFYVKAKTQEPRLIWDIV